MSIALRALCALPLAAAIFAMPAAAATVIAGGTIEHQWENSPPTAQAIIQIFESGTYTFKSDGQVTQYSATEIDVQYMSHGHTDDGKYGWGHNNIGVPWWWTGLPDPTYVYRPGGYSVDVHIPENSYAHYDWCMYEDSCGYWEEEVYTVRAYVSLNFTEESAGKTWTFEFEPFAAVPEPQTWAILIAGFGLAGVALRRRGGRRVFA